MKALIDDLLDTARILKCSPWQSERAPDPVGYGFLCLYLDFHGPYDLATPLFITEYDLTHIELERKLCSNALWARPGLLYQ